MNTTSDRPPILSFVLIFIGLVALALCLAALSPTPDQASDSASALAPRDTTPSTNGADRTDSNANGSLR